MTHIVCDQDRIMLKRQSRNQNVIVFYQFAAVFQCAVNPRRNPHRTGNERNNAKPIFKDVTYDVCVQKMQFTLPKNSFFHCGFLVPPHAKESPPIETRDEFSSQKQYRHSE